jgi:uncharacterized protein YprB with RNaseH-like and TPR domain
MLKNTFCHIPGIGPKTESRLWDSGLLSWDAATDEALSSLPPRRRRLLQDHTLESRRRLEADDPNYFDSLLPANQAWRMFPEFRHSTAYLDIETTGLSAGRHHVTTIALYDGESIFHYIHGQNLADFRSRIAQYKLIVTYNGKTFDVPFLREALGLPMPHAHIDLRYVLGSLGLTGGLKRCERKLGLDREELADVDGYFAVLLWRDYKRNGNAHALETLLAYNIADVVNLETLMTMAYNMKTRATPFEATHKLGVPEQPEIPFQADAPTIRRIKQAHGW